MLLGALGAETELKSALGSLGLEQLVGTLLKSTTPHEQLAGELSGLAGGLFGELSAEHKLEGLLGGSELTGGFAAKTVKEVSEELNTTPKAVSEELGQTTAQLPESATMLTAPLTDGKLAGVAPAVKGLVTGVLGNLDEAAREEGEEGGGKEGSGEGGKGSGEGSGKGSGEGTGSGEGKGSGSGEGGKGSGEGKGGSGEGARAKGRVRAAVAARAARARAGPAAPPRCCYPARRSLPVRGRRQAADWQGLHPQPQGAWPPRHDCAARAIRRHRHARRQRSAPNK